MTAPRRLWIRFRRVEQGREGAYSAAAAALASEAEASGMHFWVFRLEAEPGTIVEFLEGSSETLLHRLERRAEAELGRAGGRSTLAPRTVGEHGEATGIRCVEMPTVRGS